jgi:hypothetical protein
VACSIAAATVRSFAAMSRAARIAALPPVMMLRLEMLPKP